MSGVNAPDNKSKKKGFGLRGGGRKKAGQEKGIPDEQSKKKQKRMPKMLRLKKKGKKKKPAASPAQAGAGPLLLVPSLESLEIGEGGEGLQDPSSGYSASESEHSPDSSPRGSPSSGAAASSSAPGQSMVSMGGSFSQSPPSLLTPGQNASKVSPTAEGSRKRSPSQQLFTRLTTRGRSDSRGHHAPEELQIQIGEPEAFRHSLHVDEDLTWHSVREPEGGRDGAAADAHMEAANPSDSEPHAIDSFHFKLPAVGHGAFGTVYRALHLPSGQWMAVKVVLLGPNLSNEQDPVRRELLRSQHEEMMKEIEREMGLLKQCSHANVVQYYGNVRPSRNVLCLLMAYAELGSLSDVIQNFQLNESQIGWALGSVLKGLQYLSQRRICHFDIKAANLLLTKEGTVQLADFGLAQKMESRDHIAIAGTRYWMAPELLRRANIHKAGPASDIWSLGITAIELALGEPPYFDLDPMTAQRKILNDPPPGLKGDQFSAAFRKFVAQCLKQEPSERASSAVLLKSPFIVKHSKNASLNRFAEIVNWSKKRSHARALEHQDSRMVFWDTIEAQIETRNRIAIQRSKSRRFEDPSEGTSLLPGSSAPSADGTCCSACMLM